MMPLKRHRLSAVCFLLLGGYTSAQAAIAPDRTRLVFRGEDKSISVDLKNANDHLPYLAQSWIEDENGNKITSPLTVVPPVQRIEAAGTGQVKVQGMPALASLTKERETLFYFNVREIPPKSDKANTLQIALQTRIKVFYRPQALSKIDMQHPWQYKVSLNRQEDGYQVVNPTGYYIVVSNASSQVDGMPAKGFTPLVIAPNSSTNMKVKAGDLGHAPVLTYVNDYGARLPMIFNCSATTCTVDEQKSRKS
ncbi:fimbrial chaperone StfD [Citrobacter portucalensis]|uniref:Fimbrial chaperone StfD n=1 Tax=Citrobacter portucalensis TaxID=1639133 RepID=A0A9X4JP80_9ENTR|nr:fimbrial chaperone StfD [Citrobacter portucalensis]MDE9620687.1 fimbrial chaperone StfD [Citrobacter portucalensis]